MKTLVASVFLLFGCSFAAKSATWIPSARLLDAVCQIESSGGANVCGDQGRSLGYFQMQKPAWTDVSEWRKKRNLPTYDYENNVLLPQASRDYAANYLTMIHDRLAREYQRAPSPAEIYAAYNMGMNNFRKCNFDLAEVNPVTAGKCRLLETLLK